MGTPFPSDQSPIPARLFVWSQRERAYPIIVGAVAAFLNLVGLARLGYSNTYYAAAVKSMLQSWHNFFFVAFDPAGYVTVDKPPVSLWLQAISAKLFGFNGVSLILPQALAGIAATVVLYYLVRHLFSSEIGLVAGLLLALTPVSAVVFRSNLMDGVLVLVILLAAWTLIIAAERADIRWLIGSAALIGLGFNVKMLEAYLFVPAFLLVYLLGANTTWRTRIIHLLVASVILLGISLSWVAIVDSTPAADRPYVGSSATNSEINLAFGYNGIQRLTGLFRQQSTSTGRTTAATDPLNNGFSRGETGSPGVFRLFNDSLGGQMSWLVPLGLFGLLTTIWGVVPAVIPRKNGSGEVSAQFSLQQGIRALWQRFLDLRMANAQRGLLLFSIWFLAPAGFFSIAEFFHSYYLSQMAAPVAALAAIGGYGLWRDYRNGFWQGWILPIAIVTTSLVQAHLLASYADYAWLANLIVTVAILSAIALVVPLIGALPPVQHWLRRGIADQLPRLVSYSWAIAGAGMAVLVLTPAAWTIATFNQSGGSLVPTAGPGRTIGRSTTTGENNRIPDGITGNQNGGGNRIPGGFGGLGGENSAVNTQKLTAFLHNEAKDVAYPLATLNSMTASPIILASTIKVADLGGFSGNDPVVDVNRLRTLIAEKQLRYFLMPALPGNLNVADLPPDIQEIINSAGNGRGFGGQGGQNGALTRWITAHCAVVPPAQWSSGTSAGQGGNGSGRRGGFGGTALYDCSTASK